MIPCKLYTWAAFSKKTTWLCGNQISADKFTWLFQVCRDQRSATIRLFLVLESTCSRFTPQGTVVCCIDRLRIKTFRRTTICRNCSHSVSEQLGTQTCFLNHASACHRCQNFELSNNFYCNMSVFCPPYHCKIINHMHTLDWTRSITPTFWKFGLIPSFLLLFPSRSSLEQHKKQDVSVLLVDLANVLNKY